MAQQTFDGTAGTTLESLDSNWAEGVYGATQYAKLQVDGSGNLQASNRFQQCDAILTTSSTGTAKVFLPSTFAGGLQEIGPVIHGSSTQGYHARLTMSGTVVTDVRCARWSGGSEASFGGTQTPSNTFDVSSAGLWITLTKNGSDQLEITLDDGTTQETLTTSADGSPLTGGNDGLHYYANSSDLNVIATWEDGDGAGADSTAPTWDVNPALNGTQTRGITIDVDASDNSAGTITYYGVVVASAAATPNAAQVAAGTDASDVSVGAGLSDSSSGASGAATTLDFSNVPTTAQKACVIAQDPTGNRTAVYTVSIPVSGSGSTEDLSLIYETTVAAVTDQSNFSLTAGPDGDDQMNGNVLVISENGVDSNFCKFRISDYDATGNAGGEHYVTGTKDAANYTIAVGDRVRVYPAYETVEASIADNGITAAKLSADAIAEIKADLATGAALDIVDGILDLLNSDGAGGVKLSDSGVAGIYVGTVGASPTTTTMVLSGGVAFNGQHKGSIFKLLDGPVAGLLCKITASAASTNTVTFEVLEGGGALPFAPVQGNVYKIG